MLPIIYYRRDFGNIAANQTQAVIEQLVMTEHPEVILARKCTLQSTDTFYWIAFSFQAYAAAMEANAGFGPSLKPNAPPLPNPYASIYPDMRKFRSKSVA